jgi:hypothetical protein
MIRYDYTGTPFPARDADGKQYLLTPLYRLKPIADGWGREMTPEFCVGLRTELWQWVAREERGRYLILDTDPATILTADGVDAV